MKPYKMGLLYIKQPSGYAGRIYITAPTKSAAEDVGKLVANIIYPFTVADVGQFKSGQLGVGAWPGYLTIDFDGATAAEILSVIELATHWLRAHKAGRSFTDTLYASLRALSDLGPMEIPSMDIWAAVAESAGLGRREAAMIFEGKASPSKGMLQNAEARRVAENARRRAALKSGL